MSIAEPERHRLYQALEQALGPDEANTLMANLPPFAWTDVATKADLSGLREDLTRHFDSSLTEFRGEMHMKFAAMDEKFTQRFSAVDARFVALDEKFTERFSEVDARFVALDEKFTQRFSEVDARLDEVDRRFAQVDSRFADLTTELRVSVAELRSEMQRGTLVAVGSLGSLMAVLAAVSNLFG